MQQLLEPIAMLSSDEAAVPLPDTIHATAMRDLVEPSTTSTLAT